MHRLTSDWPWTLKSTLFTVTTYPRSPIVVRFAPRTAIFKIQGYRIRKNQKCTTWPQIDFEHLVVKSARYTVNTYARGPNCGPFPSMASQLGGTRCVENAKNRICTEWPQTDLEQLTIKVPYIHCTLSKYPLGPNLGPFCSTTSRVEIQGWWKSENAQTNPRLNLNTWRWKYPI